jgi:hypothetical protein
MFKSCYGDKRSRPELAVIPPHAEGRALGSRVMRKARVTERRRFGEKARQSLHAGFLKNLNDFTLSRYSERQITIRPCSTNRVK